MAFATRNDELNVTNGTSFSSSISVYQLDSYLFIFTIISSLIGLYFNILCIRRYYLRSSLRSHFTYIFHFILIYCLLASIFINPSLLIGYYGYAFTYFRVYCKFYGVIGSGMYIGIGYSLLYASIERHYLSFRKNGLLTYKRQILPMGLILLIALMTSTAFNLIPTCPYVPCVTCATSDLRLLIFWQAYSFFFPLICSTIITIILIVRVRIYRRQCDHRHRERNNFRPSKKLTIHLCIYVLWSLIYYCPPALYNLISAIDSEQYLSPIMKSISTIIGVLGIQLYPILTYFMFWNYREGRKKRSRIKPQSTRMVMNTIRI